MLTSGCCVWSLNVFCLLDAWFVLVWVYFHLAKVGLVCDLSCCGFAFRLVYWLVW